MNLRCPVEESMDLYAVLASNFRINKDDIVDLVILRRSTDARKDILYFVYTLVINIFLIKLDADVVDKLFNEVEANEGYQLDVNLADQTITKPDGSVINFDIDEFRKHRLLNGLDDIGLTLQHVEDIKAYEQKRSAEAPWLFS